MKREVFGPLGMAATTFDFARARAKNHALPHAVDLDAQVGPALMDFNHLPDAPRGLERRGAPFRAGPAAAARA